MIISRFQGDFRGQAEQSGVPDAGWGQRVGGMELNPRCLLPGLAASSSESSPTLDETRYVVTAHGVCALSVLGCRATFPSPARTQPPRSTLPASAPPALTLSDAFPPAKTPWISERGTASQSFNATDTVAMPSGARTNSPRHTRPPSESGTQPHTPEHLPFQKAVACVATSALGQA